MTRDVLLTHASALEACARSRGLSVHTEIGDPASESELLKAEAHIKVSLPRAYRDSLAEWNGCEIEIFEQPEGPERKIYRAHYTILKTEHMVAATESLRRVTARFLRESPSAAEVNAMMSGAVVITYHDDIAAFLTRAAEPSEAVVRCADMEFSFSEEPPDIPVIAGSMDEYFEKCLRQLADTLETEIYW